MTTPPPTDHVARALLSLGARDHALHLLRAAVARDPNERACAALLRAVEARPDASVSGPEVVLDLALVDAYVGRSMLVEAHAVLHGAGLDRVPAGAARAQWLNVVLVPAPPDTDPSLAEILHHVYTGGAPLALTLLDERVAKGERLPDWAEQKRQHLRHLVIGLAQERPDDKQEPARALPPLSRAVATRLSQRDWPGALQEARGYVQASPGDASARALLDALERIVNALSKRHQDPNSQGGIMRTAPMTPRMTADLNIRMGNLEDGERLYRKVVLEETADDTARQMLDDLQLVRKHLDPRTAPRPRSVSQRGIEPPQQLLQQQPSAPTPQPTTSRPTPPIVVATRPTAPIAPPVVDELAGAPTPAAPIGRDEVTRRASLEEIEREAARTRPEPTPITPTPSSVLSKKKTAPGTNSGSYTAGTASQQLARASDWEDDPATDIVRPDQEAELFLKQGRVDKAIELYEMLATRKPQYTARLEEIRRLAASGTVGPPAEMTVRRDISELRHLTASSQQSVPPREASFPPIDDDEPDTVKQPRSGPVAKVFAPPGESSKPAVVVAAQPSPHAAVATAPTMTDTSRATASGDVRVTRIVRVG